VTNLTSKASPSSQESTSSHDAAPDARSQRHGDDVIVSLRRPEALFCKSCAVRIVPCDDSNIAESLRKGSCDIESRSGPEIGSKKKDA
jgi:hypothetical protein